MPRCPVCSSTFTRPLLMSGLDRFRARFTKKRPWGCWHCGWRTWLDPDDVGLDADEPASGPPVASGRDMAPPADHSRRSLLA